MAITALVISIISISITIFMAVRTLYMERMNLNVEVLNQASLPHIKRVHLNMFFTNKSKNPISISSISIHSIVNGEDKTRFARFLRHRVAHTTTRKEITQEIINDTIPISIESYGAVYGLITIDLIDYNVEAFINETSFLEIYTSRGKYKKNISINNIDKISIIDLLDFPN
ncbi:hypothetical protein ACW0TQ_08655 [Oceanobacillus sp. M60]